MIRKRVCSSILVTALGFGLIVAPRPIRAEVDWKSKEAQALFEKQNIDYEITLARQALAAQQSSFEAQEAKLQELRENGEILDKEYKLLYKQLKNAKHEVK
ncbi:MAG: hypothetical protein Q4P72_07065, partial [Eubacteriales bacterium]|nr:hypothetical protein [Eubacteriales bacterium]